MMPRWLRRLFGTGSIVVDKNVWDLINATELEVKKLRGRVDDLEHELRWVRGGLNAEDALRIDYEKLPKTWHGSEGETIWFEHPEDDPSD